MIDFSKIRLFKGSKNTAFEECVCHLARRQDIAGEFRRVEGAGGDGGLEGYWLLPDGSKFGYQAKYFLKSAEIDWSQVDGSVEQALKTHPSLSKYYIAFPCDLTDKRGLKAKGKTGWEIWQSHKEKWVKEAKDLGVKVEFIAWNASELINELTKPSAVGLKEFWFGLPEFNSAWIDKHIASAIGRLGERYHPKDHVNVQTQKLSISITRHLSFLEGLDALRAKACKKLAFPNLQADDEDFGEISNLVTELHKELDQLAEIKLVLPCNYNLPYDKISENVKHTQDLLSKINEWRWKKREKTKEAEKKNYALYDFQKELGKFEDKFREFSTALKNNLNRAEQTKFAFITGAAGSGKSHLVAHIAEVSAKDLKPVFLFNGFDFVEGTHAIDKIAQHLDKNLTVEQAFGAINAAGEAARIRSLIVIDAINEGAGTQYWSKELPALVAALNEYPFIACIVTCRLEYEPYILNDVLKDQITRTQIYGFTTPKEQEEAAKVYLDKRGITRTATPWLNPEFVNPLFLRSVVTALEKEGKTEFPRGLHGTSAIFSLYVDAVAKILNPISTSNYKVPTLRALNALAFEMYTSKKEDIPYDKAMEIADVAFTGFVAPPNASWLEVLIRNGLLLVFPEIKPENKDPLQPINDRVCFSYQRFQDHVIAKTVIEKIEDPVAALEIDGELSFIYAMPWRWSGLISALSMLYPEKWNKEFFDCLSTTKDKPQYESAYTQGFLESIRWRDRKAFTERTTDLLSELAEYGLDEFSIILEMSMCEDHPLNVERFIHPMLIDLTTPQRDAWWSTNLSDVRYEDHPVIRVVDWATVSANDIKIGPAHKLAAHTLCWVLSTSNRKLRDKATKALSNLFDLQPDLFIPLLEMFRGVTDLYILERLFAAAYGSVCRKLEKKTSLEYAQKSYESIFEKGQPPLNLRLRDYARNIVEVATLLNNGWDCADLAKVRPPYNSTPPTFDLTLEQLEAIAKQAGDDHIVRSCTGWIGDFGRYEIEPGIRKFAEVPLTECKPVTSREKYEIFKKEVLSARPDKEAAFNNYEAEHRSFSLKILLEHRNALAELRKEKSEAEDKKESSGAETEKKDEATEVLAEVDQVLNDLLTDEEDENSSGLIEGIVVDAESNESEKAKTKEAFLALLSQDEIIRFRSDVESYVENSSKESEPKPFNLDQAKIWIASRAYEYGWTKELFGEERSARGDYTRDRPSVERIGKKYQWLALSELQCRLADNYWIHEGFSDSEAIIYDNPLSLGYERDIDPTIIDPKLYSNSVDDYVNKLVGENIKLSECDDDKITKWPYEFDPAERIKQVSEREGEDGRKFVVLYEHRSKSEKFNKDEDEYSGYRRMEFYFLSLIFLSADKVDEFKSALMGDDRKFHFDNWKPLEFSDAAYLFEPPELNTWRQDKWKDVFWYKEVKVPMAIPTNRYYWESHLDKTMPDGFEAYLPAPWLIKEMGLNRSQHFPNRFTDKDSKVVFVTGDGEEQGNFVALDKELLENYLQHNGLVGVWVYLSERNTLLDGRMGGGAFRRTEAIAWNGKTGVEYQSRNFDRNNDDSETDNVTEKDSKLRD